MPSPPQAIAIVDSQSDAIASRPLKLSPPEQWLKKNSIIRRSSVSTSTVNDMQEIKSAFRLFTDKQLFSVLLRV
jgi:hypothetical protein